MVWCCSYSKTPDWTPFNLHIPAVCSWVKILWTQNTGIRVKSLWIIRKMLVVLATSHTGQIIRHDESWMNSVLDPESQELMRHNQQLLLFWCSYNDQEWTVTVYYELWPMFPRSCARAHRRNNIMLRTGHTQKCVGKAIWLNSSKCEIITNHCRVRTSECVNGFYRKSSMCRQMSRCRKSNTLMVVDEIAQHES